MRILIVQGDKRLASMIKETLHEAKLFSDTVQDGETGLDYARSGIYDCLIFDETSPLVQIERCTQLLQEEGIPTPLLWLHNKNTTEYKVHSLQKPFQKQELLESLHHILYPNGQGESEVLSFGDLILELQPGLLCKDDQSVSLSARECELARLLISNGEEIVPKESIFLKIWGYDSEAESNVVEAYVSFLRRKFRQLGSQVQLLAVRRKGYHLNMQQEESQEQP